MEIYSNPDEIVFTAPGPTEKFLQKIPHSSSILDLGCGYGRNLTELKKQGYENLWGVDISKQLIKRAKQNSLLESANLEVSDLLDYKTSKKFDLILIVGVIEYFIEKNKRESLIHLFDTLLKKNGYIYLATFLRSPFYDTYYKKNKDLQYGSIKTDKGVILFHDTKDGIHTLFSEYFHPVLKEDAEFTTWSGNKVSGYKVLFERKQV